MEKLEYILNIKAEFAANSSSRVIAAAALADADAAKRRLARQGTLMQNKVFRRGREQGGK